ncbi:plasma membrane fusion protein prm1 [Orbilia oligospora]|uniref:Plasma membrane fusion protein PRM1 n=1 Tax=Orbilia oligospora TaxID=2813651 RepID=A0A6G1M507_ORBOL|nr:plasma membrane fusion protein prm1 [Orbilia oligospora]KAF3195072.1 plasma membrane fusion protein prm1 [Orbilia oligospora]KAF3197118.1 plasma membrane fusion protein prm1 [Orbilia oligospora]KAF3245781.1 plasma membrane fusion protein prm1 [Orbilia oligospora]
MASLRDRMHRSIYQHRDEPYPYPDLPPSLTPHRHTNDQQHPQAVAQTYHTPYLGLRARLSQIWFNRWTILLLLIVVRMIILVAGMNKDLDSAQIQAQSACTGVESMGSAMASMPHYMASGVNEAAAKGIEAAVRGLQKTLFLGITAIEAIVIFAINVLLQTYICLLTFAIRSSLGTVLNAVDGISQFVNKTLTGIVDDIRGDAKSFENAFNRFVDSLNTLGNFFGSGTEVPKLTLPSLNRLGKIQIPDSFSKGLEDLNKTIPTFDQVNDMYTSALKMPFDFIRNEMNNSLTVYQFNREVLPIPEKTTLRFCSDNPTINNFFQMINDKIKQAKNIFLGVLIACAFLVMIPMAYREWWRYRSMRQRAYMLSDNRQQFDPVDIVHIATYPYSSTLGLKAAAWFKTNRRQVAMRWWFAYISSPACLFVLSLGIAGLISVLGQWIVLKQIVNATPALANEVGEFADVVVTQLTDSSLAWAKDANGVIDETASNINGNVLGWVHTGSLALNDTLTGFVDTLQDGISDFFGGTPLEEPVKGIFFCLVELKVKGIQKGLTWAHENSQVSFPYFPNDTFSLGAATSVGPDAKEGSASFLADTGSQAADKITNVVVKLAEKYESSLLIEVYISCGLIGLWLLVCIIGAIRVVIMMAGSDKTRAEGGSRAPMGGSQQGFPDNGEERIAPVFPQFSEKSDPDLRMRGSSEDGGAPAAIGSPTRRIVTKERPPVWSQHGDIRD